MKLMERSILDDMKLPKKTAEKISKEILEFWKTESDTTKINELVKNKYKITTSTKQKYFIIGFVHGRYIEHNDAIKQASEMLQHIGSEQHDRRYQEGTTNE
jgi:hypothetical protein